MGIKIKSAQSFFRRLYIYRVARYLGFALKRKIQGKADWFRKKNQVISFGFMVLCLNFVIYQNCAPVSFKNGQVGKVESLGSPSVQLPPIPVPPPTPLPSNIKVDIPAADIDFGQVLVNTLSLEKSVTISNNTPDDSVLITLGASGSKEFFTVDSAACGPELKPMASCKVNFKFFAANLIAQDALIKIVAVKKSDSSRGMAQEFHLKGMGFSDLAANIDARDLNFGTGVVMNTTSAVQTVTVINQTPSGPISVSVSQSNPGSFVIDSSGCAALAIGATCTVQIRFTPKNTSPQSSSIGLVVTKAGDPISSPIVKNFTIGGTGASDMAVELPAELAFGKVRLNSTQVKTLKLINRTPSGPVQVSVSSAGSDFILDARSTCLAAPVAFNAACELNYSYTPSVTSLKIATPTLRLTKVSDATAVFNQNLRLSGEGFVIPPSSMDQLFLVGWYSHKQVSKLSYLTRTPDNVDCPAVVVPAAGLDVSLFQAQQNEFCFEPSGAHGLQLASASADLDAAGKKLNDYVLQDARFQSVTSLDELFASPADHVSDNIPMQEALFYYALGYLNIPHAQQVDPLFDVKFNLHYVDDGLGLVVNNRFAGYWSIREILGANRVDDLTYAISYWDQPGAIFSISLGQGKDNSQAINSIPYGVVPSYGKNNSFAQNPLKEGVNTVTAIWLDDKLSQRNIIGAKLQFKSSQTSGAYQDLLIVLPNVIQGYAYDAITGAALAAVDVKVSDAGTGALIAQTSTDARGFYRFQNIQDGSRVVSFTKASSAPYSETVSLDHKAATSAILDLSRGL